MEGALTGLIAGGKEGQFEFRDMARHFPALTSQVRKFRVEGEEAAAMLASMLQVAILGTGDAGIAANNLQNFLQKLRSPETIKRFAEEAVDITGVLEDAVLKGINPIEAAIAKVQDLTGVSSEELALMLDTARAKGLEGAAALEEVKAQLEAIGAAEKLGALFGDMQVLNFLIPMLANIEEYKRIKTVVEEAIAGGLTADFINQMEGAQAQMMIMSELSQQFRDRIGEGFLDVLPQVNLLLLDLREHIASLDQRFPGLIDKGLRWAAIGAIIAAGLGVLAFVLPAVIAGFGLLMSPLGLAVALMGGLFYLFSRRWPEVSPILSDLGSTLSSLGGDLAAFAKNAFWEGDLSSAWENLKSLNASFEDLDKQLAALEAIALEELNAVLLDLTGIDFSALTWEDLMPPWVVDAANAIASGFHSAATAVRDFIEAVQSLANSGLEFLQNLPVVGPAFGGEMPDMSGRVSGRMRSRGGVPTEPGAPASMTPAELRAFAFGQGGKEPPPQKVDVGGQVTIKVDGPGRVVGASSVNPNVPVQPDRGGTTSRP